MSLGLGIISRSEHHSYRSKFSKKYLTIPSDF